jgi:hypothetical protein
MRITVPSLLRLRARRHITQNWRGRPLTSPARVMNVRRPECDEQPSRPAARYAMAHQLTMPAGVIGPPRSDRLTGPEPVVTLAPGSEGGAEAVVNLSTAKRCQRRCF